MRPLSIVLLLAVELASSPARAGGYEALASGAQRVESLEAFLSRYIGRCKDPFERAACQANVAAVRRSATGKKFAVRIPDAAPLVRPRMEGDRFLLLVTPFVDGGGLALTHGAPAKQDPSGHPLVNLIPIRGALPPGVMDLEFQSPFRTGAIELEIVFKPDRPWKLQRRGDREYEGLAARFLGIRVLDARTGSEIASRVL